MSVLKWNVFKSGWLKQAKFFVSTPQRVQPVIFVSENGYLSYELLPMGTGYMTAITDRLGWESINARKIELEGYDEPVFVVSERSRYPIDPSDLTSIKVENSTAINDIAALKYNEAFGRIKDNNKEGPNMRILTTIIWVIGILMAITLVIGYAQTCKG